MRNSKTSKAIWIALFVAILISLLLTYRAFKEDRMPPTFVYLIPTDYFGPVVTFFGQPDGVDMEPDPLGHAVHVPEDGVVRIRARREDVMGVSKEGYRATYFVTTAPDGQRRTMKVLTDVYREQGVWWQGVIDENAELTRYEIGTETKGNFEHLPEHLQRERMIAARQGCRFRFIQADEESQQAGCDEFLVISPDEDQEIGDWLWGDFGSYFDSLDHFAQHVKSIHEKKRIFIESQQR